MFFKKGGKTFRKHPVYRIPPLGGGETGKSNDSQSTLNFLRRKWTAYGFAKENAPNLRIFKVGKACYTNHVEKDMQSGTGGERMQEQGWGVVFFWRRWRWHVPGHGSASR